MVTTSKLEELSDIIRRRSVMCKQVCRRPSLLGLSIRKRLFKNWIYANNYTQPILAKRLDMPVQEMKDKLNNHELFTQEQIRDLVYFMGADEAFKVLYFPTKSFERRVHYETFVKPKKEYDE